MGLGDLVELVYLVAGEADEGGASGDGARSLCQRVDAGQAATSNTPIRPTPPGSWKDQDSHYRAELAKRTTRLVAAWRARRRGRPACRFALQRLTVGRGVPSLILHEGQPVEAARSAWYTPANQNSSRD